MMRKKVMMVAVVLGVVMSMAVGSPALAASSSGVVTGAAQVLAGAKIVKVLQSIATGPIGIAVTVLSILL